MDEVLSYLNLMEDRYFKEDQKRIQKTRNVPVSHSSSKYEKCHRIKPEDGYTVVPEFMCSNCGKSFGTDFHLESHDCIQDQREKCPKCDVLICTSEGNFKRHIAKCDHHPSSVFFCEKCGGVCSTKYGLEMHMKICRPDGKSGYKIRAPNGVVHTITPNNNLSLSVCLQSKCRVRCRYCDVGLSGNCVHKWLCSCLSYTKDGRCKHLHLIPGTTDDGPETFDQGSPEQEVAHLSLKVALRTNTML